MVNIVKKILLSVILISFLISPTTTMAEEITETVSNTANIISNVTLLSPATWPVSITFKAISGLVGGGGNSDKCSDANIISSPFCAIAGFIVELQKLLATQLVGFGQTILTINTNSDLLTQASSQNNIIVQSGWGIVRNIANAALVIGLIIIAITIILGYQENKAKQLLVTFILIALLINFTPVICSFIIDGSNILTASFLAGGTNTGFADSIGTAYNILNSDTSKDYMDKIVWGTIYFIFAIIATVIMCLYALLFMARTVILWILVIVSPIAFATKVFPQSKYIQKVFPSVTYWDNWWESFVQWTVISIPAAISLYISIQLMSVAGTSVNAMNSDNALDTLMAFATPFIFMIAGFFITISSGGPIGGMVGGIGKALGAGAMTGAGLVLGAKVTKEGLTRTGGGLVGVASKAATRLEEGVVGAAGALYTGQPDALAGGDAGFRSREIGRGAWNDWKTRQKNRLRSVGLMSKMDINKQKDEAREAYNQDPRNFEYEDRRIIERSYLKDDATEFMERAVNNQPEYQRRAAVGAALGGDKAKLDIYLHASSNMNSIGGLGNLNNFVQEAQMNPGRAISGMSGKDLQEKINADAIRNNPAILLNLEPRQARYFFGNDRNGTVAQRTAMREGTLGPNNQEFHDNMNALYTTITTSNNQQEIDEAREALRRATEVLIEVANIV